MTPLAALWSWLSASDAHVATAVLVTALAVSMACVIVAARDAPVVGDGEETP